MTIKQLNTKRLFIGLLVAASFSIGVFCYWSTFVSLYYRAKYYSGTIPQGRREVAARRIILKNLFFNRQHAVLINMSLPSSANNRLKVYNLHSRQVVFATRVMHGKQSGKLRATRFSNKLGSNRTALGRYVIVGRYRGKFGRAYRLAGLDDSNSNALSRSIVLHSSNYINTKRIGRSEGCPAVSRAALVAMKPYLHIGTLVWVYR